MGRGRNLYVSVTAGVGFFLLYLEHDGLCGLDQRECHTIWTPPAPECVPERFRTGWNELTTQLVGSCIRAGKAGSPETTMRFKANAQPD